MGGSGSGRAKGCLQRVSVDGACGVLRPVAGSDGKLEEFSYRYPGAAFGLRKSENMHRVPKSMWQRWSEMGRFEFNQTLVRLRSMGWTCMKHPEAPKLESEHFETLTWNAACIAADVATQIEKDIRAAERFGRKK